MTSYSCASAAARVAVAAVWLYEGLWCKVLGAAADHRAIVAAVPALSPDWVTVALVGLGVVETGIALWVLIGRAVRAAAFVQIGLLVGLNAGGLLFAADQITHPGRMLTQNAVLLTLVWLLAQQRAGQPTRGAATRGTAASGQRRVGLRRPARG